MKNLLGVFAFLDDAAGAMDALRERGFHPVFFGPTTFPGLEDRWMPQDSRVKWFTLTGALLGILTAVALTTWVSVSWPMIFSGKPVVSIPPYVVIYFELMVLFGAIANLTGLLWTARIPRRDATSYVPYDPRVSDDHFGVLVEGVTGEQEPTIREIFQAFQAVDVHSQEVEG